MDTKDKHYFRDCATCYSDSTPDGYVSLGYGYKGASWPSGILYTLQGLFPNANITYIDLYAYEKDDVVRGWEGDNFYKLYFMKEYRWDALFCEVANVDSTPAIELDKLKAKLLKDRETIDAQIAAIELLQGSCNHLK